MKRILPSIKIMLVVFISSFTLQQANAQTLLTENFDYASGTLLTAVGWTANSGTSNPVSVVVPGLTFANYPLSNIGGTALLGGDGQDVNKTFTAQTTGNIYVSFMFKMGSMVGGYFLHLGQTVTGTTHFARVWVGLGDESLKYKFGLTKTNETPTYSTTSYPFFTTLLIVLKYKIVDGTNNDEVSLFVIDGTIPANEPATATIPPFTTAATDYSPGSLALRQYSMVQNYQVDGIRIAKSWAEAVTATAGPDNTAPAFTFGYPKAANINATQSDLQVIMDEAGKAYYVVVKDGDTPPTAEQVFAGLNYGSVTLVKAGNIDVPGGGTVASATITGLADKTDYDIYVVAQDDEETPNKQTTPLKVDLYTVRPMDVISNADFNTSLSPFTQVSITGDQVWDMYTINSENKCAKMSGYINFVYYDNLDYLISPQIDLGASESNKLSFSTAKSYTGPALKVMISTNFNGTYTADAVKSATWSDITSNFAYSTGSFIFASSSEFSLSAYSGKVYIAFVFESSTTQSATWEVDNFLVTGYKKATGINDFQTVNITLYPVPARTEIFVRNIKGVTAIEVFDIHGKIQMTELHNGTDTGKMDVSRLTGGVYLIRFNRANGPVVMKFIKE